MKILKKMILLILFGSLTNCHYINGQEKMMSKEMLESASLSYEIDGNIVYLIQVRPVKYNNELQMESAINGDYYLYYEIIKGNYPKSYYESGYHLHVIPEKNVYKLETRMESSTFYENGENVGHADPIWEWVFVGYSTKNILEAKILEYYIENIK
jgi:hypothetical protein